MSIDIPLKPSTRKRPLSRPATLAAVVLVAIAASGAARAAEPAPVELRPIEAKSLQLGDINGVAYYTLQDQGYHVVVTLAGEGGTPVRFESTLSPGQKLVVSMAGIAGAEAPTVEFSRQGDRLLVETSPVHIE